MTEDGSTRGDVFFTVFSFCCESVVLFATTPCRRVPIRIPIVVVKVVVVALKTTLCLDARFLEQQPEETGAFFAGAAAKEAPRGFCDRRHHASIVVIFFVKFSG